MNSTLRNRVFLGMAACLALAVSACAGPAPRHAAAASPQPNRLATVVTAASSGPHFRTPQAAMKYLALAYNRHDRAALHEVTTPKSYRELTRLRSEAVDLRLRSCAKNGAHGDYICTFIHNYPASLHKSGHGSARMLVAPARNPGWYLYAVLECG